VAGERGCSSEGLGIMADSFSFGKTELVASTERTEAPTELDPGTPFHIAVIGNFSGRVDRGPAETGRGLAGRGSCRIDRDNFDEVMAGLGIELRLPIPEGEGARVVLRFRELEDFHPDRIYGQVDAFRALREVRRKLDDPTNFEAAAREMGIGGATGPQSAPREPVPGSASSNPAATALAPEMLLERILDETRGRAAPPDPVREAGPWSALIERLTAPYRVAAADPRQAELLAGVDAATGQLMREILHHPDFQALEAAWRSLHFLTRRLETDGQLTISLVDVTKAELAEDLDSAEDLRSSGVFRLLVASTADGPGGRPWAVLIGDMTFEPTRPDVALLGRMAEVARHAGAPFLAAAGPRILGCESLVRTPDPDDWRRPLDTEGGRAWESLRHHPASPYLGLALPRFLLRLPYGRESDPIESFAFEEWVTDSGHESYLWGNPAFLLGALLGRSFGQLGWRMRPEGSDEIEGLPLHVYRRDGEPRVTPCAEVLLSDHAAEIILDGGLMPLLSLRDRDVIRLGRFQSIAELPTPLAGRWHH
jgi:type VI secretion system protein ImpC